MGQGGRVWNARGSVIPLLDTVLSKSLEPPLIGKWVQGLIEIVCKYK